MTMHACTHELATGKVVLLTANREKDINSHICVNNQLISVIVVTNNSHSWHSLSIVWQEEDIGSCIFIEGIQFSLTVVAIV